MSGKDKVPNKIKWYKSARSSWCKGLILHVKPEHQKSVIAPITHPIPPICHARPMHQTQPIDQGPLTSIVPTVPKPRIGQGRAGIKRKPKIALPTPKPIQTPSPPIPTPAPREVQSLPEPVVQLQERVLLWHQVPAASPSIVHPTPAHITQPLGPRIEHRSIPPYHEPFLRPPPRPPDVTDVKNNRKDLLDLDTDRNIDFKENSPYQEGIISEMYERPDKSLFKNLWN